jgi:hypothetical protein
MGCWSCFLISVGCGLLYQWLAIRLVWDELHAGNRTRENARNPGFRTTWWIPSLGSTAPASMEQWLRSSSQEPFVSSCSRLAGSDETPNDGASRPE